MSAFDPIGVIETGYASRGTIAQFIELVGAEVASGIPGDPMMGYRCQLDPFRITDVNVFAPAGAIKAASEQLLRVGATIVPTSLRTRVVATAGIASMEDWLYMSPKLARLWMLARISDSCAVVIPTAEGHSIIFGTSLKTRITKSDGQRALWRRLVAHLGAALRLDPDDGVLEAERTEAVLRPDGTVADARGAAQPADAQRALRQAVTQIDRARTRRGRSDPEAALDLWHGLLAGRWSLVDHFDTDGQRFIVAQRNDPACPAPTALTRRQRQVAFYASCGWSHKEVAYALGLSVPTVAEHLDAALSRLGMISRAQLVRMAGELFHNPPHRD